ncbi:hypothetical protein C0993_003928, partial [Termitomyces sp. T159_Od127]
MRVPSTSSSAPTPANPNRPPRAMSTASFVSSPLNPSSPQSPHVTNPFASARSSRAGSRASHHRDGLNRGSMLLYRLASDDDSGSSQDSALLPPKISNRASTVSVVSVDSKYPLAHRESAFPAAARGMLVAYEYDPGPDELEPADEEDLMHDPTVHGVHKTGFPWRGILNVAVLVGLVLGLLCLFVFYPVLTFYRNEARNSRIDGNIRINGTAPVLFQMPDLIDKLTPDAALTRTGFDGQEYQLVFSDEFETDGRSFYPGDDPFWEAVDLWYGATGDLEWYDPQQVSTRNGSLVITLDSADTLQPALTPGSTAPFTPAQNHNLNYRSGMLQSWNKFCFSSGYIEVSVVLPGANSESKGYVSFPDNPTPRPHLFPSGPAHGQWATSPAQATPQPQTACGPTPPATTRATSAHSPTRPSKTARAPPPPSTLTPREPEGRHVPGQWEEIHDHGQVAARLPLSYANFFPGFEYWGNPKNPDEGYITWQVDGVQSHRLGAAAVAPDQGPTGSGVGQRLIPVEPMSIVLNLGISPNWQTIDPSTLLFPAEMLIDYVRVYQRKGATNVGCNPKDFPTADYIAAHRDAYE